MELEMDFLGISGFLDPNINSRCYKPHSDFHNSKEKTFPEKKSEFLSDRVKFPVIQPHREFYRPF